MFNHHLFRKVAIVGVGFIGGSLAMALRKKKLAKQISGYAYRESSLKTALDMKIIDEGSRDLVKAVNGADLVILATPVQVMIEQIRVLSANLRRGTIITDVGSSKTSIVDAATKELAEHVMFVGSHPIAGSEKSGVAHANGDIFFGARCLMTPVKETNRMARDRVKRMWELLGMKVDLVTPSEHDEIMALTSHLPHLAAFALMRAVPDSHLVHGGGGLLDTTRIAASSEKMWADICLSNPKNVLKAVDEMVKGMGEIRKAIIDRDEQALSQIFTQARVKRETLGKKTHV